jgi:hypothetical protein
METIYQFAIHVLNGVLFIAGTMLAMAAFNFRLPVRVVVVVQEAKKDDGE